jgi:imidazole glycerol phosphate synthase glutamine amidotransferase subunit
MNRVLLMDYGVGNSKKIKQVLEMKSIAVTLADFELSKEFQDFQTLILPGVGSFDGCMESLKESGNLEFVREFALSGKKIVGICAGAQITFERSEEGTSKGLGLINGDVISNLKINHGLNVGRKPVKFADSKYSKFTSNRYYFSHSFQMNPNDKNCILARTSDEIPAFIRSGNIYCIQFHPEKSGMLGIDFLHEIVSEK